MADKKQILQKIEGLVLVTEENRSRLREFAEKFEKEEDLKKIEELLDEEAHVIERVSKSIIESELEAGDPAILQVIDDALKDAKNTERKVNKVQEGEEKPGEEQQAESLLQQY